MVREENADVHKVKTVFPKAIRVLRETARIPTGIITAVVARLRQAEACTSRVLFT